jgi:CBS domain containing-hemolysin-like protein
LDPSPFLDTLLLAVFLGLSALFFASEFAFFSVSEDELERTGNGRSRMVLRMLNNAQELMITLLLGSSVCSALSALFALRIAWRHFPQGFPKLVASVVALILISLLIAILARLLPRFYVAKNPEASARALARPIFVLYVPFYPVVKAVHVLTSGLFLAGARAREMLLKSGQLRAIARAEENDDGEGHDEQDMINAIFDMRDTMVREIMVPRIDMVCAEATTSVMEAVTILEEAGHSRIPIYAKTIDNVLGILHARDLFGLIQGGGLDAPIGDILREPYFVPESKRVGELLKELRRRKTHMAIVVDEFGGVVGLVTLEDVLEEIVGEIYDEHEEELELIEVVGPDEVRVDGKVRIEELNETIGTRITEDEDYDTIAGYLYNLLGKVPSEGDQHEAGGLTFVVEKVTGQRIERVLIMGDQLGRAAQDGSD